MEQTKQAVRDALMTVYLSQVLKVSGPDKLLKYIELDMSEFINNGLTSVPVNRRLEFGKYTEQCYIHGVDTKKELTEMFLSDAKRILKISSELISSTK